MIELRKTCSAMPEQYNAYDDDQQVGYLRLRHGIFTVECPACGDTLVYSACPNGDGCFDDNERDYFLRFAVAAIHAWQRGEPTRPPAPDVKYEIGLGERP